MHLHRNSQKRYYCNNRIYFITTNTELGYPFFNEDIFCEVFVDVLSFSKQLKGFELLAYKINPNHVHLLIQPGIETHSEIMRCLKTNV